MVLSKFRRTHLSRRATLRLHVLFMPTVSLPPLRLPQSLRCKESNMGESRKRHAHTRIHTGAHLTVARWRDSGGHRCSPTHSGVLGIQSGRKQNNSPVLTNQWQAKFITPLCWGQKSESTSKQDYHTQPHKHALLIPAECLALTFHFNTPKIAPFIPSKDGIY